MVVIGSAWAGVVVAETTAKASSENAASILQSFLDNLHQSSLVKELGEFLARTFLFAEGLVYSNSNCRAWLNKNRS